VINDIIKDIPHNENDAADIDPEHQMIKEVSDP
jgi:hypothetical protein